MMLVLALITTMSVPSSARAVELSCAPAGTTPIAATAPAVATPVDAAFPAAGGELTVFAAASLVDAFGAIATDLEAAHPGLHITIETAGSQTLVTQLTEGAHADVLATANLPSMANAQAAGVITGEPVPFTGNRLVIVTPPDNPAGIESVTDLTQDDLLLVIAGEGVPAGQYARTALCTVDGGTGDYIGAVGDNVVSEETDVRGVLAKVQIGQADAGIVYASDAFAANQAGTAVNVIEFPEGIDTATVYPIAPVTGGNAELAAEFIAYVRGPEGQQTLRDFGFSPLRPSP